MNVLAETAGGDPNNVVLLGAHLDSVPEGPGINDNGSTAATVLQVALALANQQHSVRNKVRFAWWGAEEMIDVGSGYYVSALSAAERQRIAAVLNGELIAAPNDARFVWDPGTGGSHVIAGLFGRTSTAGGCRTSGPVPSRWARTTWCSRTSASRWAESTAATSA